MDDDPEFADGIAESLAEEGHQVRVARTGMTAIEAGRELQPDVVLLDLGLPDIDGTEVARALRQLLPSGTPIIVLTGRRDSHAADDIDLVLNKPVPSELFGGFLEYMWRRRRDLLNRKGELVSETSTRRSRHESEASLRRTR